MIYFLLIVYGLVALGAREKVIKSHKSVGVPVDKTIHFKAVVLALVWPYALGYGL